MADTAQVQDSGAATAAAPPRISEDWTAVWIGGVLIAAVLLGLRFAAPRFGWADGAALGGTVFGGANLASTLLLGLLILIPSAAGAVAMGGRLIPFIAGFPIIYALGVLSQLAAGNAAVAGLGLEYVLFALVFGLVLGQTTPLRAWFREAVQAEYFIKIG